MQKKYTLDEQKGPSQKATVLHFTPTASAGAHLHSIYMAAHSDHYNSRRPGVHHLLTFCDCFLSAETHPISGGYSLVLVII